VTKPQGTQGLNMTWGRDLEKSRFFCITMGWRMARRGGRKDSQRGTSRELKGRSRAKKSELTEGREVMGLHTILAKSENGKIERKHKPTRNTRRRRPSLELTLN